MPTEKGLIFYKYSIKKTGTKHASIFKAALLSFIYE